MFPHHSQLLQVGYEVTSIIMESEHQRAKQLARAVDERDGGRIAGFFGGVTYRFWGEGG